MAASRCPRGECEGTTFEITELRDVKDAVYRVKAVQCATCGAVVGVLDHGNASVLVRELAERLGFAL